MVPPGNVPLGQFVVSQAGRDIGHTYIVVGHGKPPFILVADGRVRTAAKPKTKNVRHVKLMRSIAQDVAQKLRRQERITDEELRQAILNICTPDC